MILPALIVLCGPVSMAGVACLIAGEYRLGLLLFAVSWALGFGLVYLAWRANTQEDQE